MLKLFINILVVVNSYALVVKLALCCHVQLSRTVNNTLNGHKTHITVCRSLALSYFVLGYTAPADSFHYINIKQCIIKH